MTMGSSTNYVYWQKEHAGMLVLRPKRHVNGRFSGRRTSTGRKCKPIIVPLNALGNLGLPELETVRYTLISNVHVR
jgi:hypothetical protein